LSNRVIAQLKKRAIAGKRLIHICEQLLNSPISHLLDSGKRRISRPSQLRRQSGYMLLSIMIMATIGAIWAAAILPRVAQEIRREREEELIHRGTDYARAVKRFYKKNGRYPARMEELESSNNIRYLRKRWRDPVTGSDQWRIIHFGEAKVFPRVFGNQPTGTPAGSPSSGTPPTGTAPATGTPLPTSTNGPTPPAPAPGDAASGTPGATTGSQGTSTPATGSSAPASSSSGSNNQTGPTFGGAPIIGVASSSQRESLKELNGKNHYNEWEFFYDPRFDPSVRQGVPGVQPTPQQQPGQLQQNPPTATPTMPQPNVPR